jgi:hypothetical protein
MKKNLFYAMMSAIALTSAVSFTACSSDDAVVDNPNYDATTGEVKTAFTLSVGSVTGTRMTTEAVQQEDENPQFKGMTDIYLFPFKSTVTTDNAASTLITESYINLANFNSFDAKVAGANGKIYKDVNLSVGVNHFLFYGVTQRPGNGKLKASYLPMNEPSWDPTPIVKGTTKVTDLKFDLVPIQKDKTLANDVITSDDAKNTIAPLNAADAAIATQIAAAHTANAESVETELTAIQNVLRNKLNNNGNAADYVAYAGSSASIKNLMQMLYTTLKNKEAALTVTDPTEINYATSILTAIETYFAPSANATTGEWTLAWNSDPDFPANTFGVPAGAAAVQYVLANSKFEFVLPSVEGLAVTEIAKYTYPASLYYFVNSRSMVKDALYLETTGHEEKTWDEIKSSAYGNYSAGAITPTTRSVIIDKQVQYAVGRLDVQVRVMPNVIIKDNSVDKTTGQATPQPVSVPNVGYTLTGVLIGGQKQVGWDFKPIESATEMTIWDNVMTGTDPIVAMQQTEYSAWNHTLALETVEDEPVNIALEFENTGNDFVGHDHNLIPAGTKFYLVAQLDPTANGVTGYTSDVKSVFKQDYITKAKLTINENSLKSAYNVVPDLRSPKLEFGLSVNLEWQNGLVFEQDF